MDKHNTKLGFINIAVGIGLGLFALGVGLYMGYLSDKINKLGGTTANTELTDTINTFRLNVNNLNSEYHSTSSTDPGHVHTSFASTTITNASTTNITATGYGLLDSLSFTNATGTNASFSGIASSSQLYIQSSTSQGSSTFNSTIIIGQGSSTVQCMQMYSKSTSTLFYIGVNTSTGALFATSTKPSTLCN